MSWNENICGRNGRVLNIPTLKVDTLAHKTLRRYTIQHEGVSLLNILLKEIRNFSGEFETFKTLLDNFLSLLPDHPLTEDLKPVAVDRNGSPSNSIYDWIRKVHIVWEQNVELLCVDLCYVTKMSHNTVWGRLSQSLCSM